MKVVLKIGLATVVLLAVAVSVFGCRADSFHDNRYYAKRNAVA